jgi:hypothetical protein
MKNLRFLAPLALLSLLASSAPLGAQGNQNPLQIKSINVEMVKTPDYSFSGTKNKRSTPQDWLEIEVEFENSAPLVEEMTVRVHVIFKQMMNARKYFTGEVTHINVLQGRGKFSVMYIPPGSLKLVDAGKVPSANDLANVGVEILQSGRQIALANLDKSKEMWWTQAQPMQGHVLNKNQTPFAPLFWDRYEQIKIESR